MDPESEDIAVYAAQAPLAKAAWAFVGAYWVDYDMRAAWLATHPTLRRCWVQAWLMPHLDDARAEGYDLDELAEAFADDEVEHPLWEPFARTQIEQGATLPVDRETWGTKVNPDFIAPGVMLVRLLPVPDSGVIQPGERYMSVPLLMQHDEGPGWRLLNFVSDQVPVPGWPPQLGAD
ncbi:hypothetical protein [Streptomyces sp. NBC_01092]|uniref:hypothetical protein n=1 Tax=Streptomyces sp. NBC_01092 TaxID=2903748 RepID=UPI003869158F|nr:hypothetical protein OG254_24235 [Streptomyces sp. NBC_01092]